MSYEDFQNKYPYAEIIDYIKFSNGVDIEVYCQSTDEYKEELFYAYKEKGNIIEVI